MNPTLWALVLALLSVAFLALELFIPSGGLLGFLASCCLLASVVMVYSGYGLNVMAIYLALIVAVVPVLFFLGIKYWPHTPIGRRVLNLEPGRELEIAGGLTDFSLKPLLGKKGLAKTVLLPCGAIEIEGKTYDAISDGSVIERGDAVEVVEIEGTNIVVRKAESAVDDRRLLFDEPRWAREAERKVNEDPFGEMPI